MIRPFKQVVVIALLSGLTSASEIFGQETVEEKLLEEQAESSEQSELLEILLTIKSNPVDLNGTDLDRLGQIPGLPPNLPVQILNYRTKHGRFRTKADLLRVPGVDDELYQTLSELVFVREPGVRQTAYPKVDLRTRVTDRIEKARGFQDGTYESSSQKLYNRVRFQVSKQIRGGFLLEKDSGESRLDDLRLFYLSAQFTERITFFLGNYHLEIGQGLILWGPYGFSKGADTIYPIRKKARGVRGYTTVDENAAFLGGAFVLTLPRLEFRTFVSQNKLDATARSEEEISNFFMSGFHRNPLEREKKDVVTESVAGGSISYLPTEGLSFEVAGYYSVYDKLIANDNLVRNRFDFRGDRNFVAGLNWEWVRSESTVFGEFARSRNGGSALIAGIQASLHPIQLAFSYRDYAKDFQNLHGFGFAERNGATQNERGYYTGLHYKLFPGTTLRALFDIFQSPWRTFFQPLPTEGRDFLGQIDHRFRRGLELSVRFREKVSQATEEFQDAFQRLKQNLVEIRRTQLRLQLDYSLTKDLRLRNRLEYVRFSRQRLGPKVNPQDEDGLALYQDIQLRPIRTLLVRFRMTFFDTDSFNSRIFQYENDLPGIVTNRALFGAGNRWYAVIRYTPYRALRISAKYSETFRDDVDVIGTGPDEIDSNIDRRFGIQIELRF